MKAKNMAAVLLLVVTLINYVFYRIAVKKGEIKWGEIDFRSQYVLIFFGFSDIWLMNLMGAVRELVRKDYHVYLLVKGYNPGGIYPDTRLYGFHNDLDNDCIFCYIHPVVWLGLKLGKEKDVKLWIAVK